MGKYNIKGIDESTSIVKFYVTHTHRNYIIFMQETQELWTCYTSVLL